MTETALKKDEGTALTEKDVKEYLCPTATKKEIYMFLNIANSYGLNPFKREIHFVKYGNQAGQIIVGYEIYLKRAEATGQLDGWRCWMDGKDTAKIIIHRKDRSKPFEWEVDRAEFDKKQSAWKDMPNFMLKKVCIAQGFRLCFPEQLGGIPYIPEEIVSGEVAYEKPLPLREEQPEQETDADKRRKDGAVKCAELYNTLPEDLQKNIKAMWGEFEDMEINDLVECYKAMKIAKEGANGETA